MYIREREVTPESYFVEALSDKRSAVGFISATLKNGTAILESIHIQRRDRGGGYGSLLIIGTIEWAKSYGARLMWGELKPDVLTPDEERRVRVFYEKHGFVITTSNTLWRGL